MIDYDIEIYERLVDNSDDIEGLFAFSCYMNEKIMWFEMQKRLNDGRLPLKKDMEAFHRLSMKNLSEYKKEGELSRKRIVDNEIENARIVCQNRIKEQLFGALNDPKRRRKEFWTNVWSNIVSAFLLALFPFVFVFVSFLMNPSITVETLKNTYSQQQIIEMKSAIDDILSHSQ